MLRMIFARLGLSADSIGDDDVEVKKDMSVWGNLKYFQRQDFQPWDNVMSEDLLEKLDKLRSVLGVAISPSKHPRAIGRHLGQENTSQHNVDRWGEVRAVDVFIKGVEDTNDTYDVVQKAIQVGFTGIGVYPDAKQGMMFHFDVREGREAGSPALWARVDGEYVGIGEVLPMMA